MIEHGRNKLKTVWRLENPETEAGMWYNKHGELDPFIMTLTEGISKDLPMEKHERYGANGKRWYSGCHSLKLMERWFSLMDVFELINAGYHLMRFEVSEFVVEENQTIFTREGIVSKEILDIETVWPGVKSLAVSRAEGI